MCAARARTDVVLPKVALRSGVEGVARKFRNQASDFCDLGGCRATRYARKTPTRPPTCEKRDVTHASQPLCVPSDAMLDAS